MPKYRATVYVSGLTGDSPRAVRNEIDEQLRKSGLQNCRVVGIDLEAPMAPRRSIDETVASIPPPAGGAGGWLLIAAATWALLFFWWMLSASPE